MTAIYKKLILATFAASAFTGATLAYHPDDKHALHYDSRSKEFRSDNPLRVFIDVNTPREHHERGTTGFEARTLHAADRGLPSYIQIVGNRRQADMVVQAAQTAYSLDFRVVDVDREDKKYKKAYRHVGGRCGHYIKAYYTEVKEKGEAYAAYNVSVTIRGGGRERDTLRLRSAEDYRYGKNLTARTNCGTTQTHHYPSKGVAELFAKASPEYREHVARDIRREAADDLGRALARQIRNRADNYYAGLAVHYSERYDYHDRPHYSDSSHIDDHDHDDQSGWRIEYGHQPPHRPAHHSTKDDAPDEELGAVVLLAAGLAILAASSGN